MKNKKKDRQDIINLFQNYTVDSLALKIQNELLNKKIELKPIWYHTKYDQQSQKYRTIGIQDITNQIYDYIAVNGLKELESRIGKYQCASIKGRGQIYCANAIFNHIKRCKYAIKLDIRKYYESIPQDKLLSWLKSKVKNDDLLWLINEILKSFDKGLSIGSYLSQDLGNLYLSDLYHFIETIKHRDKKVVKFQAFYMDDILICGDNSRQLIKASNLIEKEINKLGLSVKPNWQVINLNNGFIDMVGFRLYKTHKTIRRKNLKRIRRAYLRFNGGLKTSQRVIAYYGYLKHSNSQVFCNKYNVYQIHKKAKGVVSNENKKRCEA